MEKKLSKLTLVLVALAGMISLNSCQDKQVKSNEGEEHELVSVNKAFDARVDYKLAMGCVDLYKNTPLSRIKKKTESVSFDKNLLKRWTDSLELITTYDKMTIRFGIYTPEILTGRKDSADKEGKLTVFLFPTLNGVGVRQTRRATTTGNEAGQQDDPYVDPFNMGEVHP